jgi:hypothetical protein
MEVISNAGWELAFVGAIVISLGMWAWMEDTGSVDCR